MADEKQEKMEVLRKFADVAALAGIRGEIDEEELMFVAGFELKAGRSQMVYVRPLPGSLQDKDAVCIHSPCRRVKKGFMRGLGKDQALELLLLNSELMLARYNVVDFGDEMLVMASVYCALETLDPSELEDYFWHIAIAADNYEEKFGGDDF